MQLRQGMSIRASEKSLYATSPRFAKYMSDIDVQMIALLENAHRRQIVARS